MATHQMVNTWGWGSCCWENVGTFNFLMCRISGKRGAVLSVIFICCFVLWDKSLLKWSETSLSSTTSNKLYNSFDFCKTSGFSFFKLFQRTKWKTMRYFYDGYHVILNKMVPTPVKPFTDNTLIYPAYKFRRNRGDFFRAIFLFNSIWRNNAQLWRFN